ncbi:MAG: hypothetical protein HY914_14095 [Desulfomonile tiedjei]|nr:hypothetical protein [Desulfomonile tiedjei]
MTTGLIAEQVTNEDSDPHPRPLGVNERLWLIGLIDGAVRAGSSHPPLVADLFSELGNLVDATVRGAKIDRLQADESNHGFRVLEINGEAGENLGRLNMLYLKKPIPCYYLVYVEVAPLFRRRGLGNLILQVFRDFLVKKSAVGILDNIIPREDPTYDIYVKLNWRPIEEVTLSPGSAEDGVYMIFLPPNLAEKDLKDPVLKLVHHLKRKRPAIDMRDNELMVERTIREFKEVYAALLAYFKHELERGEQTALMRFMFTRFVTKLLGFRRRIGQLLGYTGGESLLQIVLDPGIRSLPVQSYAPRELAGQPSFEFGDRQLWHDLPDVLKKYPARMVESLPNYRRPSLVSWMENKGISSSDTLTIGDLLDLGFDPTRLKEFTFDGEEFIFERVQPRMLAQIQKKKELLERIGPELNGKRVRNALVKCNPPLLVIRDRGNGYVLRRKVEGIHWEEATEQLQVEPRLQGLNRSLGIEKLILSTVRRTAEWLGSRLSPEESPVLEDLTYFVAWNLDRNQPKLQVDFAGSSVESIWIA